MKNFSPFLAPAPRDRCASSLTPPRGTLIRFPVAVQCEGGCLMATPTTRPRLGIGRGT